MAKSKKKQKALLPKRVAGIKVPRAFRRGRAARFLASPLGVAIVSDALVTAGALAAGKQARPGSATRRFADHPLASMRHLGEDARDQGAHSAETLRNAFEAASSAFAGALRASADAVEPASKKAGARDSTARAH